MIEKKIAGIVFTIIGTGVTMGMSFFLGFNFPTGGVPADVLHKTVSLIVVSVILVILGVCLLFDHPKKDL